MKLSRARTLGRLALTLALAGLLSGCVYWWRAYQTYVQMSEFDRYFKVESSDDFTLHFNDGLMYSEDFVSLARLRPSEENTSPTGKHWRYWFRKIDKSGKVIKPRIEFHSDLNFNQKDLITDWSFSSLFLEIAPPKFLEVSLRSIGGADINQDKMQLKADTSRIGKVDAELPSKEKIVEKLGEPLRIDKADGQEIYVYHFRLVTPSVEEGYEDRRLSEVNLSFDSKTQKLVKMAGRFAGLKISINYGNLVHVDAG